MKIVVLAGGLSKERDVSLSSGSKVANTLLDNGHDVCLIDLFLGVETLENVFIDKNNGKKFTYEVTDKEPDLEGLKCKYNTEKHIGKNVLEVCKMADLVFVALHGSCGEDGKLQALFELEGIKFTGTSSVGCALAMDKELSKKLMVADNIKTARWVSLKRNEDINLEKISFPCVVKPCSNGSSMGVSIVETNEDVKDAIEMAFKYEDKILVEEYISGREFSVGVLDNNALPAIEIITNEGFYDYKNKYQAGLVEEICPANIEEDLEKEMSKLALKVHKALHLGYYSRIDFRVDNKGNIYCLEANTLPGMTPTSLLPQEAQAAGISYENLCEMICSKCN